MESILMPDDVQRVLGRLEAGIDAIIGRADRSDELTERKFREMADLMETNKQAAIAARGEKHEENKAALSELRESIDGTAQMARNSDAWIEGFGKPLITRVDNIHDRVTAIEDKRRVTAAEERGSVKTWTFIGAIATALGGALAGVITYGRDAIDFVKGIGH